MSGETPPKKGPIPWSDVTRPPSAASVNSASPHTLPPHRIKRNDIISQTQLLTHLIALQLCPRAVPSKHADNPAQQHRSRLGHARRRRGNHTAQPSRRPEVRYKLSQIHSFQRCCLSDMLWQGKQPHDAIPLHPSSQSRQPPTSLLRTPISDFNRNSSFPCLPHSATAVMTDCSPSPPNQLMQQKE